MRATTPDQKKTGSNQNRTVSEPIHGLVRVRNKLLPNHGIPSCFALRIDTEIYSIKLGTDRMNIEGMLGRFQELYSSFKCLPPWGKRS